MALDGQQTNGWWGRPLWAEIDLDALAYNVASLKGQAGPAAMAAVVKANAYGHGAVGIAQAARERRPSHRRAGAHAHRQLAGDGPRPGARGRSGRRAAAPSPEGGQRPEPQRPDAGGDRRPGRDGAPAPRPGRRRDI